MRKFAILTIACLLASLLAVSADAARPKKRTRKVTATYSGPSGAFVLGNGGGGPAATIIPKSYERYISIKITDDSGQPVAASLAQNLDEGATADDNQASFCGSIKNTPISGLGEIYVYVTAGTCDDGTPSTPTTGSIAAKLTNRL